MLLKVNDHKIRIDIRHNIEPTEDHAGYTDCCFDIDGQDEIYGVTLCSRSDHFSRRIGRKIALLRAMQAHPLTKDDKELRRAIWLEFFRRCKMTPAEKAAAELAKLHTALSEKDKEIYQLKELIKLNETDTGGGCSICGGKPVTFRNGDNWMCSSCIQDTINELNTSLLALDEVRKIIEQLLEWHFTTDGYISVSTDIVNDAATWLKKHPDLP
jgi:hypothetical protein